MKACFAPLCFAFSRASANSAISSGCTNNSIGCCDNSLGNCKNTCEGLDASSMMPCAFTQTAKSLIQASKSKEAYEFTIKQPPLATIRLNSKVSQQSLVSSLDSINWVHNLTFQEMPQIHMRRTDCYGLAVAYLRFRDRCEEVNTGRKRILMKAATRALKETLRCVPRFLCAALIRRVSRSFLLFAQNATKKQSGLSRYR